MQKSRLRNSDKLNIVDRSTFTQIQQNSNGKEPVRKIRNAKYKKKHQDAENDFDLLKLIAASSFKKGSKQWAYHKKGATLLQQTRPIKKGGKSREIRQRKLTRLKKNILQNREIRNKSRPSEDQSKNEEVISDNRSKDSTESIKTCIETTTDTIPTEEIRLKTEGIDAVEPPTDQLCEMSLHGACTKPVKIIHSRRFREYCDNCTTKELAEMSRELISDLNRFQKRAFQKNPIKANAHRRIVVGFREVRNNLRINKVKLVLIATDCEKCDVKGGIDDEIESLKDECKSLEIPYAFSLQRRQLAHALKKNGSISCVGVLDYDGARDKFSQFLQELQHAREKYADCT